MFQNIIQPLSFKNSRRWSSIIAWGIEILILFKESSNSFKNCYAHSRSSAHPAESVYFKAEQKQRRVDGRLYRKIGGGRQEHQSSNSNTSPAAPIKLVMLNKLGGNEGAYLFFSNLGSVVFLPFSILPGRNFWPPLSVRSSQTKSSQKGNESFLSEEEFDTVFDNILFPKREKIVE